MNLKEISPLLYRTVSFGGDSTLTVRGLSALEIVQLCMRFPKLGDVVNGGAQKMLAEATPMEMIQSIPEVVWAAFAVATGTPGDAEAERVAAQLPISIQVQMVLDIMDLTFREGVGPFLKSVLEMMARLRALEESSAEILADGASATGSPSPSPAALVVDMPPGMFGRTRRAS